MFYFEDHIINKFIFIHPQRFFLSTTCGLRFQGSENGSYPYVGMDVEEVIRGGYLGGWLHGDDPRSQMHLLKFPQDHTLKRDMNSDESTYLMLPYKYLNLFPISTSTWFNYLYKKLHAFMNTGLDSSCNMMGIDRQISTELLMDMSAYSRKKNNQVKYSSSTTIKFIDCTVYSGGISRCLGRSFSAAAWRSWSSCTGLKTQQEAAG